VVCSSWLDLVQWRIKQGFSKSKSSGSSRIQKLGKAVKPLSGEEDKQAATAGVLQEQKLRFITDPEARKSCQTLKW
jgi:hypothetical protein